MTTSGGWRPVVLLRGGRNAVLVHGCFWHGCPQHFHAPKANADWWRLKLESVVARDADTERKLAIAGYPPVVVWEHEDMALAAQGLAVLDAERRLSVQGVSGRRSRSAATAGPDQAAR